MALDGHRRESDPAMMVCTFAMAAGSAFEWHTHEDHQLAWAPRGVLTVVAEDATWVLPPTRALWIPARLPHETRASGSATMQSIYIRPDLCPISWPRPTPLRADPLLAELVGYLDRDTLDEPRRTRAEAVLTDLLEPAPLATIEVRMPTDERARDVAQALGGNPADKRTLDQWGHEVGASGRTLARAFLAGTGIPFGRWRTLIRLQAALPALAAGRAVGTVARQVGYESSSAFVAAFRHETGLTPMAYVQDSGHQAGRAD